MRLIDADKLIIEILTHDLIGDDEQVDKTILNAPTVEAIPIEWFKKKIDRLLENGIYGAEVYQWVLNRWYEDKEYWEKENAE